MIVLASAILILALLAISGAALVSMSRIQQDSEDALLEQMDIRLQSVAESKSLLADTVMSVYTNDVRTLVGFAEELYENPENYAPAEVLPPSPQDTDNLTLQRYLVGPEIKYEDIRDELELLANLEPLLEAMMEEHGEVITDIYVATLTGGHISYNRWGSRGYTGGEESYFNYYNSDWYTGAIAAGEDAIYYTDVYEDGYGRGKMISCSSPVFCQGKLKAVISMDVLVDDLQDEITKIPLPRDSYALLLGRDGRVIVDTRDESIDSAELDDEILKELVADPTVESGAMPGPDENFYAFSRIESNQWTLCIVLSKSSVLEPLGTMEDKIRQIATAFLLLLIPILGIVLGMINAFARHITRPLSELKKDVEIISSGNLDWKAEVLENNEVGDLAISFNQMTDSLRSYIDDLTKVTGERERLSAELDVANKIQRDMLPGKFPPFPDRTEFSLYASMTPAKEVGGDFYDFFFVDEDHLALVIADVSGKGIPAALFMMSSMIQMHDYTLNSPSPAKVLEDVNHVVCMRNDESMFVTVWLGILELSTGRLTAANAGHEYPILRPAGRNFSLVKERHGLPIGAMDGSRYSDYEFQLKPGADLFVYSDGLPEAVNNSSNQFGTDRIVKVLNDANSADPEVLIREMDMAVQLFSEGAPPFDDLTMLCIHYSGQSAI
ncbi:MAG: SpoIIE family protein phosphatase [Lachnospiraceae bacterium]|nr:SpoIIE family protein phosphatase [Lachnospiraceae bacterium]